MSEKGLECPLATCSSTTVWTHLTSCLTPHTTFSSLFIPNISHLSLLTPHTFTCLPPNITQLTAKISYTSNHTPHASLLTTHTSHPTSISSLISPITLIRNLEPNCECYSCCCCSEILAKSSQPPQNLHRYLKTFPYISFRYRKCHGGIVVMVLTFPVFLLGTANAMGVGITDIPDSRTRGHQGWGWGQIKNTWPADYRTQRHPQF